MPTSSLAAVLIVLLLVLSGCGPNAAPAPTGTSKITRGAKSAGKSRPPVSKSAVSVEAGTDPAAEERRAADAENRPASTAATNEISPADPAPPRQRPPDRRLRPDDDALVVRKIHRYESRRLILYSDIASDKAESIPPLIDQLYEALVAYFGPLPLAEDGSEFQMTGYIMADPTRFRASGVLPEDLPGFLHGRHRGLEFWMNEQPSDYYRGHLACHEATHCFMTITPQPMIDQVWYLEGMAELFGTHRLADGQFTFRWYPDAKEAVPGLGRIRLIQDADREDRGRFFTQVLALQPPDFLLNEAYAWSWAVCQFLDHHPHYRQRFREQISRIDPSNSAASFERLYQSDGRDLAQEFALFRREICHGYDFERSAIAFGTGRPLTVGAPPKKLRVEAERGWQASGVLVEQGEWYELRATGSFTIARTEEDWISEPQGVSIRYYRGRPLGQLIGTIREEDGLSPAQPESMQTLIAIGPQARFQAPLTGTLYLRLNDAPNELHDNSGAVQVQISHGQP